MANKNNVGKIKVEREVFEKDGKTFYSYFIKGQIRGKEVRILVTPPDKGGFTVLDIVFGNEMQADLVVNPYEIKKIVTVCKAYSSAVGAGAFVSEIFGDEAVRWFCILNIYKYRFRAGKKPISTLVDDEKKAAWYEAYVMKKLARNPNTDALNLKKLMEDERDLRRYFSAADDDR